MPIQQFMLPDLGEGLTEGDILKWVVAVGDTVAVNDTIAEVETVKAAVELPSPFAGVVTALHAAEGETVPVGTAIISIETAGGPAPVPSLGGAEDLVPSLPEPEEKQLTLVGYGPQDDAGGRRRRRRTSTPAASAPTVPTAVPATQPTARPLAKPPVRKLAKELGIDLGAVVPTGADGTISRDDVRSAANGAAERPGNGVPVATGARETRVPIRGVRKHTAAAMVSSAFTAPHVTEFVTVDVSATMELRDRVAARREFRDLKVTPLLFVAKAVLLAAGRTPEINSTWDDAAGEIVLKHFVNLGIAAATERGLVVPNVKDADRLSMRELAEAIAALTATARAGRATPADMSDGTFTITNIGVFGVDTGTPILNPGEAGILAVGAIRRMPWVVGTGETERIEPRWVTQLGLSFDHRLVDGAQGSQFLSDVAAILHDPGLALL